MGHENSNMGTLRYQCDACEYTTSSKTDLDLHREQKHGVVGYCRFCHRVAPEWTNELGEVRTSHCLICGAQLSVVAVNKVDAIKEVAEAGIANAITPHYYKGRDVMDIINRYELGFCLGQVIKYVLRARHKNGVVDLRKAMWYLKEEISQYEQENKS